MPINPQPLINAPKLQKTHQLVHPKPKKPIKKKDKKKFVKIIHTAFLIPKSDSDQV